MEGWNAQALRDWAQEAGFAQAALCRADDFEDVRRAVEAQPPIAERRQLRFFPSREHPRARSLAVLLWAYRPARVEGGGRVFVDSYYHASNAAYHAAKALEARVLSSGGYACANVNYPAREAAVRAGLGVIGRNGLLITPRYGTRVVIILMATDLPAPEDGGKATKKACDGCGRCRIACPAGAIDEGGMSHPERCLRNFMMEGVTVPLALREKMGQRLLGCDICQRVCPMQPDVGLAECEGPPLSDFLTLDERAFSESVACLAHRVGRNVARPQRVRAQAALLAGNACNEGYLPVLQAWADSPHEAVREHARWAIDRISRSDEDLEEESQRGE